MLDTIDKVYRSQSARIFQLRLSEAESHSVIALSFFDEDSVEFALKMPTVPWSKEQTLEWEGRSATRIRAFLG